MDDTNTGGYISDFLVKMEDAGLPPLVAEWFDHYYRKVLSGDTGLVYDRDISPVKPSEIGDSEQLDTYADTGRQAFGKSVRIVLNGGLGTSMGLTGPKSLIEVKNNRSFLEIILRQAQNSGVELALMNSFSTGKDTAAVLSALKPSKEPISFFQHRFPKVLRKNLKPAVWPADPHLEWNPPGHGDIYPALQSSGMLKRLLDTGIRYAFISNVDNLGARMSARLLGYFVKNRFPFMMEVAEKTPADIKGGHLARYLSGRLLLREAAQCPADEIDAFQDIQRYGFFNTNSIWVNLESLNAVLKKHRIIDLPMILNPKTLDPRDETSPPVYQIETAMGAAISLFEGATAVKVPRSRFAPVKTCNDLLAVRSDCYEYTADETLRLSPKRNVDKAFETVKIKLDRRYYGKIDLMEERFKQGEPSLVNCESLTIEGDVHFEGNVSISGQVFIQNTSASPAVIKEGTVIDRDIQF